MQAAVAVFHPSVVFAHETSDIFICCHRIAAAIGEGGVAEAVEQFALGADVSHQATHIINHTMNLRHGHAGVDYGLVAFKVIDWLIFDIHSANFAHQTAYIGLSLVTPAGINIGTSLAGTEGCCTRHLGSNAADEIAFIGFVGDVLRIVEEYILHRSAFPFRITGKLTEKTEFVYSCKIMAINAYDGMALAVKLAQKHMGAIICIDGGPGVARIIGASTAFVVEFRHRSDGHPEMFGHVEVGHQKGFGIRIFA